MYLCMRKPREDWLRGRVSPDPCTGGVLRVAFEYGDVRTECGVTGENERPRSCEPGLLGMAALPLAPPCCREERPARVPTFRPGVVNCRAVGLRCWWAEAERLERKPGAARPVPVVPAVVDGWLERGRALGKPAVRVMREEWW